MILIEVPVHDVTMYVNTRCGGTTTYFSTDFYRTDDWVNSPYEMLLKSHHTDELNSPVSCIYCWYLTYRRLELFSSPMCDLQILLALTILDYLLSYRFTVSPVSMAYGQLANSPRWRWYTVVISYGWVSKPYKRDRNNTTAIPDELVLHSKSIPMVAGKLVSLLKLSETATSRISHGWPRSPVCDLGQPW